MKPGVVEAREFDGKGRLWERIRLSSGHLFVVGPDLTKSAPFCWGHKSPRCWATLSFNERKAVSDAEEAPRGAGLEVFAW